MNWSRVFPFLDWLATYNKADRSGDIIAGLTVAVMLIPQGMAYAMLAGLPPIIGLYASTIPLFIYALMGSSKQLAVGPVAIVSIMVASALTPLAEQGSAQYVILAALLALMVGLTQFLLGVMRGGYLVNFLSHPVISGFTSAAALIIGFSQLKHLLGIEIPRSHHVHTIIDNAASQISEINIITALIGGLSIAALVWLPKRFSRLPASLLVVVLMTVLVWLLKLANFEVAIVGDVPAGLPGMAIPGVEWSTVVTLIPTALLISMVAFLESISVAKALAAKRREQVDANQELMGLGLANIFGGLFHAYPVTGGFSRSAVNAGAGARTGLASIITALVVAVSLLFFTPLFQNIPRAALAAIIMVAVFGLIDVKEMKYLWRVSKLEFGLLLATFFATLSLGVEKGILLGVVLSLMSFIIRTTRPHNAELGRLEGSDVYRNLNRYPDAEQIEGLKIIRIDASLYFANVEFLKDRVQRLINDTEAEVKSIILDASSTNYLDSSAEAALEHIYLDLQQRSISLRIANAKGPVLDMMKRSGLYQQLGEDKFFYLIQHAVDDALSKNQLAEQG